MQSNLAFLCRREFLFAVLFHQLSVTIATLKLPFEEAKNSFNLSKFLFRLLMLRWQIENVFPFSCLDSFLKFLKEKYKESIS